MVEKDNLEHEQRLEEVKGAEVSKYEAFGKQG